MVYPFPASILTLDRLKPQAEIGTQQDKIQRTPQKPPGLSTPPETVSEPETRPEEDDSDSELCFICGNSMKGRYYSLAPCNNAFCHNCSLRLRALYKSTNCPFCKVCLLMIQTNDRRSMKRSSLPSRMRDSSQNFKKLDFNIKIPSWESYSKPNRSGKIQCYS
jgi:hypothetical protein